MKTGYILTLACCGLLAGPVSAQPASPAAASASAQAAAKLPPLGAVKSYDDVLNNPNIKNKGLKAMLIALKNGTLDINATSPDTKTTPVVCAANADNRDLVAFLLSQGADISGLDPAGKPTDITLISAVVSRGNNDLLKELIAAGADVNKPAGYDRNTPFIDAAANQNMAAMELLRAAGADAKAVNKSGKTALFVALHRTLGKVKSADFNTLIDYLITTCGIDPNARDEGQSTALLSDVVFLSPEQVAALVAKGADPLAKDKEERGLVGYVTKSGNPTEALAILKSLEKYPLDFNNGQSKGPTPLHDLLTHSRKCADALPLLEYLIAHGTRTDSAWPACDYSLMYSAAGNNIADSALLLQYLIDHKLGDVNVGVARTKTTPLMNAAQPCMVEALLKAGADATLTDNFGKTAHERIKNPKVKAALEAAGITK